MVLSALNKTAEAQLGLKLGQEEPVAREDLGVGVILGDRPLLQAQRFAGTAPAAGIG